MANKKFTDLSQASAINETDIVATSQYSGGMWSSLKATISQIANKIVSGINYNSLNTTDKTIIGAINEAAQSGGSGGHTILDDDGNALSQEDNLQFVGVYSEDDSVNDTTKVNIVREMTQAQYDLLSADEKKGIIRITDKNYVCDASDVAFDNTETSFTNANVEGVLKEIDKNTPSYIDKVEEGIWNLLRLPYYHSSGTSAGTTRTVNADGSITVTGTASQTYNFNVKRYTQNWVLPKGTYRISGCPSGGSSSSYYMRVQKYENGNLTTLVDDYGDGAEFTLTGDTIMQINAGIYNGYAIQDSITFRPTITRVKFPACDKTTSGIYTLQATVDANGNISYEWVSV